MEPSVKETIRKKAIALFNEKGYHGTSVRDIAKASGCSIPMVYYYYNSKGDLFEEIVYEEFIRLIDRLNSEIDVQGSLEDIYCQAVRQRKALNSYDRAVYRLATKVWLGFDGGEEVREKLLDWERQRFERNRRILSGLCGEDGELDILTGLVLGVFQNLVERILLLEEEVSDETIRSLLRRAMG